MTTKTTATGNMTMRTVQPTRVAYGDGNPDHIFTCGECGGHDVVFEHTWVEVSPYTELHTRMDRIREGQEILVRKGKSYTGMIQAGRIDEEGRLIYAPLNCTNTERRPESIVPWTEDEFPAGEVDYSQTAVEDDCWRLECGACHSTVPFDWTSDAQIRLVHQPVFGSLSAPTGDREKRVVELLAMLGYSDDRISAALAVLTDSNAGVGTDLLTPTQLATALGIAEQTVLRMALPYHWVGKRKRYRLDEVLAFMDEQQSDRRKGR